MTSSRAITLACSLGLLAFTSVADAGENSIRIGVLTDLSSFAASSMGPGSVLATKLAVEDFGGKVLGKPVEVIQADMQSKPDLAVQIARRWYESENVDLIVDVPASAGAIAIQGIATQNKKLFLATVAATPELTGKSCSPYAIHWGTDTVALARGPVTALAAEGVKTWFLLMPDYALGKDLVAYAQPVIEQLGGKVLETVYYPTNTTDYAQYLLRARASGADVIGTGGVGLDLTTQIKQAVEFGILQASSKTRLAAFVLNLSDVHAVGLQTMGGVWMMQEFYWDRDDVTRAYAKKFFAQFNKMPNYTQSANYSAVTAYLKTMEELRSDDPAKIVARMKETPQLRFGKPSTVRADGRAMYDLQMYRIKTPEESKAPWDYLKPVTSIQGDKIFLPPNPQLCSLVK
jgi:branched-chain amino acid transport system substrate-binding protein